MHKWLVKSELKDAILARLLILVFFYIFTSSQLIFLHQWSLFVAASVLSSLYHTCLIGLCWAVIGKEINNNIWNFIKENTASIPLPLCANLILKKEFIAEIYVVDTDFISWCGLGFHSASFVVPGAGKAESATAFQCVATQRISVFTTTSDVLK